MIVVFFVSSIVALRFALSVHYARLSINESKSISSNWTVSGHRQYETRLYLCKLKTKGYNN